MLLLGVLALALLIGLLRGGRLAALTLRGWRALPLPFLAVGAQVIGFLPDEGGSNGPRALAAALHVASYLVILTFIWLNRRHPWMWLVGLGAAANAAVIIANGGFMPISPDVALPGALGAGISQSGIANNIAAMDAQTRLWFLGDILRTPGWLGPQAFSVGDVALAAGGFALVQRLMRGSGGASREGTA